MSKNPEIGSYIDYITDYYLGVRLRSEKELRDYLTRKLKRYDIEPEDAQDLISKKLEALRKYDLINDLHFAKVYVDEKTRFKQRGEYRIKLELRKKGIADSVIAEALEFREESDDDILPRLLMFKYKNVDWKDPKAKQRAMQGLMRRGFGIHKIKKSIEEILSEE